MSRTLAAKMAELAALRKRAAELERHLNMSDAERRSYVAVHDRADHVARCFGDSAPRWNVGESRDAYRCRLVGLYQKYSPTWAEVDFTKLSGSPHLVENVLCRAEEKVYADAVEASRRPESYPPGVLKENVTTDRTGRNVSNFVGDFEAAFGMFKLPTRSARIAKPSFRG